jgi:hypothetical protein
MGATYTVNTGPLALLLHRKGGHQNPSQFFGTAESSGLKNR